MIRLPHTALAAWLVAASVACASAQTTTVQRHNNKYTPAQDVQIGQEAAQEVRRELPMLDDRRVDNYVEEIGRRLVRHIPQEFQYPEFRYSFDVVNQQEINAFALPGGPMFLHRGMIDAAKTEGEVAGVMAHEIAHVALRHGTAQATKAQGFQIGAIAGQILGAIVGGTTGSIIAQGSEFGLSAYFLKYSREYEREADLLGARIMAAAGYDPRGMADMFRTIEAEGGSRGPEWLSSHPNPGNRYEAIQREAATLQVQGSAGSPGEFRAIQARLDELPPAYTAEQVARARASGRRLPDRGDGGGNDAPVRAGNVRVEPPSGRYQRVTVGNFLRMQIPSNWGRVEGTNSVTFAPDGAHYQTRNGSGFTHGLQMGVIPAEAHSHQQAMDELLESLAQSNPQIRQRSGYSRELIAGRNALTAVLSNVSATGGTERVTVTTVPLRGGDLLYLIAVVPEDEASAYAAAFRRVKQTIELNDRTAR